MANKNTIEAYGVREMKIAGVISWRKEFKNFAALNRWVNKNGASFHGVRDIETGDSMFVEGYNPPAIPVSK